jgi:hypothetical protein
MLKNQSMKRILPFVLLLALFSACTPKNYLERSDEDKALLDAVKKLNKSATDENALAAVPILYSNIQKTHMAKANSLATGKNLSRWDQIIGEYETLQNAYNAIINSTPAFKLVTPQNFSLELLEAKQKAAEQYYRAANRTIAKGGRDNAKTAYGYYKKSDKYIPAYKDAREKMEAAFESSIVNVIINPVQDNSYFNSGGWGSIGTNYSNEYFQQTLLRELQSTGNDLRYAARFYTDWQATSEGVQPDWVVDLRLRNMDIPYPLNYNTSRNASAQVKIGTDTSGKPVYQTVYATVNIVRSSFTARADMEVNITDVKTRKNISYRTFREDYRWQDERATYSGDSRALSSEDWRLINNTYNAPRKEDILDELYRKIYPQVKSSISYATSW